METQKDFVIKLRFYSCLVAKSGLLEFRGFHAKFCFHYILCSLPTALFFISFDVCFCLSKWKHTIFEGRRLECDMSWKGDTGVSIRHLLSFFIYIIYYSFQYSCIYLSIFYRRGSEVQRHFVSSPRPIRWQVGQFGYYGKND